MNRTIIFGIGDHAQSVAKVLKYEGVHVEGFCVDDDFYNKPTINKLPVFKTSSIVSHCSPSVFQMFLPLSFRNNCKFREEKFNYFKLLGYSFFTFFSKNAQCYSDKSDIGENVYIGAFAGTHPNVVLKDNVYISEGALIGHNSIVGSHSFIGANAVINGSCKIGKRVTIGANAVIREGVRVVDGAVIGIGVAIHRDITTAKTYIFTPLYEKHYGRRNSKKI